MRILMTLFICLIGTSLSAQNTDSLIVRSIYDEALEEGDSLHLLSVDYEYLDQPRRLDPPGG